MLQGGKRANCFTISRQKYQINQLKIAVNSHFWLYSLTETETRGTVFLGSATKNIGSQNTTEL